MSDPRPKLAAYVSAWDLIVNDLPYKDALRTMLAFFDEVTVAVNTSKDDTAAVLRAFEDGRLRVIDTSFAYTDVTFDGAVKNAALQACTQGPNWVYVQMDMDEIPVLSQRDMWRDYAAQLLAMPAVDCFLIPSVDLYQSMDAIRADRPVGVKFRMHKGGLRRGVWNRAWIVAGKRFDTSMSDSTELIDDKGGLVRTLTAVPYIALNPGTISMLRGYPYTFHLGYVSLEQRVRINKAIWADHWTLRNGGEDARVATRVDQLTDIPLVKHNLPLT